jgi:hypothetical protein
MAAHLVVWTALGALAHAKEHDKPNFLIIFVDDMGIDQIQVQSRADTTHSSSCISICTAIATSIAPCIRVDAVLWQAHEQHCNGSSDPRAPTLAMLCARSF